MGKQTLEAVFEKGAFRPLDPDRVKIPEGQRVQIVLETEDPTAAILALAMEVYQGLSEEEIEKIERIALNRRPFFADRMPQ